MLFGGIKNIHSEKCELINEQMTLMSILFELIDHEDFDFNLILMNPIVLFIVAYRVAWVKPPAYDEVANDH